MIVKVAIFYFSQLFVLIGKHTFFMMHINAYICHILDGYE
jgi:hypothetical protein